MPHALVVVLAVAAWLALFASLLWLGARAYLRRLNLAANYQHACRRARDIRTLHPGTKALMEIGTGKFLGYKLPSGRVVQQRYWTRLEGKESAL